MNTLLRDIRYALRMLLKNRGFTAAAILSLGLGIGANTAVFSVVNAVLLKSLPYHQADRIVLVWGEDKTQGQHRNQVSATDIADYRARSHVFEAISTYSDFRPVLTGAGEPERIVGAQAGDGFFEVLHARPLLGRFFTPEEQRDGNDYVAVLSYGLWQKRFAADPAIVGKTIMLSSRPYTVVGVTAPEFQSLPRDLLPAPAEFYRPVAEQPDEKERASRHLRAIGRLKEGVTLAAAQAEMDLITAQLRSEHPATNANSGVHLVTLRDDLVSPARPALLMLFGAVVCLLLIGCANVGNLLLARSIARYREIAIRSALGASRSRIVRQFLTESVLLAVAGGIVGLVAAVWSTSAIEAVGARVIPMLGKVEIDSAVLIFTLLVSTVTGIAFGAAPALRASRVNLNDTLNDGGRAAGAISTRSRLRSALVVAEVALAMVLLVSAGLLIKTVVRLSNVDPGFNPKGVLTMNVWLPRAKYPKATDWNAFYDRLLRRIESLPGVTAAGLTSVLPVTDNFDRRTIELEGEARRPQELGEVDSYFVSPGYLSAIGSALLRGRNLADSDNADAPLAVLVSESFARKHWPNEEAIGKQIRFYNSDPQAQRPWRTIVGVVNDVKQYGLDTAGTMAVYAPIAQMPSSTLSLVVRANGEPSVLLASVRREILALDPEQAVFNVVTMERWVADSIALRRVSMVMLAVFSALALLLAAIGIYAVLAQLVAQRTHEIGIRMALGAQAGDVIKLIAGHGLSLTLLGVVAGVCGALALTRLITTLLFGVGATDPVTFVAISMLLLVVAAIACYLPARRAARLDPVTAISRS